MYEYNHPGFLGSVELSPGHRHGFHIGLWTDDAGVLRVEVLDSHGRRHNGILRMEGPGDVAPDAPDYVNGCEQCGTLKGPLLVPFGQQLKVCKLCALSTLDYFLANAHDPDTDPSPVYLRAGLLAEYADATDDCHRCGKDPCVCDGDQDHIPWCHVCNSDIRTVEDHAVNCPVKDRGPDHPEIR